MKILREKTGMSLIFVLAAMMLLMVVGVSVITAASLSFGANLAGRDRNQLELYVSSMERTVRAALVEDPFDNPIEDPYDDAIPGARTLGGWILREAYQRGPGRHTIDFPITLGVPEGCGAAYTVGISASMNVQIIEPVIETVWEEVWGADPEGLDGEENIIDYVEVVVGRSAQRAMINGTVTVTQSTEYQTPSGARLSMTTKVTYRYSGGLIEERGFDELDPVVNDENMWIAESGEWTVVKHE